MKIAAAAVLFALIAGCAVNESASAPVSSEASAAEAVPPVRIEPLADGVWMHTSYERIGGTAVPSHGLIVEATGSVVLIDTGWNDDQTNEILDWAAAHGHAVTDAVFTHAHSDKMGGVAAVEARGIRTYAHRYSNADAPARGLQPAGTALDLEPGDSQAPWDGVTILYPGPGHTRDNIVVGLPHRGIVFGGCLVRPGDSRDLGNTADGDIGNWAAAAERVAARFPEAGIVIPSHGAPGGRELLTHTADLAKKTAATR